MTTDLVRSYIDSALEKHVGTSYWGARHAAVLSGANSRDKGASVAEMVRGLSAYVEMQADNGWKIAEDYVLGQFVLDIALALKGLLDGEIGGLDGGETWRLLDTILRNAGFENGLETEKE